MEDAAESGALGELDGVVSTLRAVVGRLEAGCLAADTAVRVVEVFTEVERLAAAGRTMVARRVEESNCWRQAGFRSAAHFLAAKTRSSLGSAVGTLETARGLDRCAATAEAFRAGRLSAAEAAEIVAAASERPQAEAELLATAATESVTALRNRCRQVRAQGHDEDEAYERVRRSRYLRHWTEHDGAVRLDARLPAVEGAQVLAAVDAHRQRIFAQARAAGCRESSGAYAADALVALAQARPNSTGSKPPTAMVHVRVDHAAFVRGHVEDGETCEIPGVGPIPVAAAQRLADDAILKAIVTRGADVTAVAHLGRTIPATLRTAVEARDPECVVPGCHARLGLEIDHRVPFAKGGPTRLDNLARLCGWHHYLKTHHRYRLAGEPGTWSWSPPEDAPP